MQVTNTTQTQNLQIKNMQAEQLTLTQQEISLVKEFLNEVGSLKRAISMIEEGQALLKANSKKSKKRTLSDEEKAEKQRLKDEKAAAKKLAATQAKAEKAAAKKAKKLAAAQAKAEKAQAKEAKKLAAAQAKAEKAQAKEAKKLAAAQAKAKKAANAGPKIDGTYTKKIFVRYANYNENKTANAMTGINGKALRIARKKDGSDTTVYRHNPNNWTDEATELFESLSDKWDKKERGFSPDYNPPVKKSSVMAKKIAVEDTDEEAEAELELEMPKEYVLYRKHLRSNKSGIASWVRCGCKPKDGMVPLDKWCYMRTNTDKPFNDKVYEKNPEEKVEEAVEDVDMKDSEGNVVGNHVKSFVPVVEEKVVVEESENDEEDAEVSAEEYVAPTIDEYDEDGFKPFEHFDHFGEELKMRRDGAVFFADNRDDAFIGYLDLETNEIVDEQPDSSSDDSEKDDELFD